MNKFFRRLLILLPSVCIGLFISSHAQTITPQERSLNNLVDQYFSFYFEANPSAGTDAGFHEYDAKLEDLSLSGIQKTIRGYSLFEKRFQEIDIDHLSLESAADHETLLNHIRYKTLELQTLRPWEKDPDLYGAVANKSIFSLISRNSESPEKKLANIIAREKQIPSLFAAASQNLSHPPKVFVEMALSQIDGTIQFFKTDVPLALKDIHNTELQTEFRKVHETLLESLNQYKSHLTRLLPKANGDYRLGAANFSKLLLYKEGIATSIPDLFKEGNRNLLENQELFRQTLAKLKAEKAKTNPSITEAEVFDQYSHDHPDSAHLIEETQSAAERVKTFLNNKSIITIPEGPPPLIQATPDFQKELTDASMETPGLYEKTAAESYFYVTIPDPSWPKDRTEEHLQSFNRPRLLGLAIHELYPGHYLQYLRSRDLKSKVRKLLYSEANSEGWAHYCEQMVQDEGFETSSPSVRLGQLQDALLRNARYIVAIGLHTGKMTLDQAVEFFIAEGKQSRATAEREARRGTSDPTYLTYTLGKLQILQLREDYKRAQGAEYSLKEFNDEFLKHGPLSVPMARKLMGLQKPLKSLKILKEVSELK